MPLSIVALELVVVVTVNVPVTPETGGFVVHTLEATGSLDATTAQQITDLFVSLNRDDGITFLVVTHRERAVRAAGRVLRLEDGRFNAGDYSDRHLITAPPTEAKP